MSAPLAPKTTAVVRDNPPLRHLERHAAGLGRWLGAEAGALEASLWDRVLIDPAREFLAEPGKGFRARLVQLGWELGGGVVGGCPEELGVALEWLHAGSLIIDDIEDGAHTRRGQPALHLRHGLGRALNTGNWLYFAALHHIDQAPLPIDVRAALQRRAIDALLQCHAGQALDLSARVDQLPQQQVASVVTANTALKTGALMALAAELGATAAEASSATIEAIGRFGAALGEGLQMLDDAGSVLSERRRDKAMEDLAGAHPTWTWAWLATDLDAFTWARLLQSLRHVDDPQTAHDLLSELRQRIAHTGRTRPAQHLAAAFAQLRAKVGESTTLQRVEAELERLKVSYV
jgi:geranylgeranyl diphosphate synthase type I